MVSREEEKNILLRPRYSQNALVFSHRTSRGDDGKDIMRERPRRTANVQNRTAAIHGRHESEILRGIRVL